MLRKAIQKVGVHDIQYFLILAIVACFIMAFSTYASPAYYFDYSPDNNAFFSVGKAMVHGIVPYKDIFEQKGPYIYLLHAIAYLLSARNFIGIFIFEIITMLSIMILVYKISQTIGLGELVSFFIAMISPALFLNGQFYDYGDTVEYYTLPMLLSLVLLIFLLDRYDLRVSPWWYFVQGVFVGIVFLSKYTLLGAWIIFYIGMGIFFLSKRLFKNLKLMILWSGFGFLVATIPWLLYFLATKSLADFVNVYILFNTQVYITSTLSIFSNFVQSALLLSQFYFSDVLFFVLGLVGTLTILLSRKLFIHNFTRSLYLLVFLGNDLFALYGYQKGAIYQYYQLVYFVFFVPALIFFFKVALEHTKLPGWDDAFVIISAMICSFMLVLGVNDNILNSKLFPNNKSITEERTDIPQQPAQIQFGRIMRSKTPKSMKLTLLNYGSIDMGFYTASGAVPSEYYFQNYNIPEQTAPQILKSQRSSIKHHRTEWIVLNTPANKTVKNFSGDGSNSGRILTGNINSGTKKIAKNIYRHYRVVAQHTQQFEGTDVQYWLFQRKEQDS